jgi:hypothetical protein
MPVPGLVASAVFAAVQKPWRDHQRHARPSRRGALDLLPGLGQGQHGGSAYEGTRRSPSARQGRPRADADDRCLGPAASRVGGARRCQHPQGRTDLLALAVWQALCGRLAHPERLAPAYQRRVHADRPTTRMPRTTLDVPLGKRRQGLARWIDRDTEALSEQPAVEPRLTRLRQRIAPVEAQRQQRAEAAALDTALRLIIGRLEDLAAQVQEGLAEADWSRTRELLRALVTRVEVAHAQVQVGCRSEPRPGDPRPGKKGCQLVGGVPMPPCGTPVSGWSTRPAVSRIPAFSHFRIRPRKARSSMRQRRIFSRQSWSMWSTKPWMSASPTSPYRPYGRSQGRSRTASPAPRSGRYPSRHPRNSGASIAFRMLAQAA